jgi:hypothetical protein
MFRWIWSRWNLLGATVDDTTATIRAVVWSIGGVAVITVVVGKWLASLNTIQRIGLWVVVGCLTIIALTYFFDWQRKRAVDKIPELLAKMDSMVFDYLEDYDMAEAPPELYMTQ